MLSSAELKRYRTRYNALPDDVEAVSERLSHTRSRLKVLRGALKIIDRHGAGDYLALLLLHRHFECVPGAVFVERRFTPRKGHDHVLVTRCEPVDGAPTRVAPHRFRFDDHGRLQPLEFTTDTTARSAYQRMAANEALTSEIGRYLVDSDFDSLLGVAIYPRRAAVRNATVVYLEETDFRSRSSVVHLLPRLPAEVGRAIPTLWTVGTNAQGCCSGRCVAYCSGHGASTGIGYCGHRNTGSHMVCV
jgi:hypothetical protein